MSEQPEHLEPETLRLTLRRLEGGPSVVSASGEIDVATAGYLKETLKETMQALAAPGRGDGGRTMDPFGDGSPPAEGPAVVDLTGVSFMDSTGLGALIAAHAHAARLGRTWRLCGLQPSVHRVFALSGAQTLFGIYPDVEAAISAA